MKKFPWQVFFSDLSVTLIVMGGILVVVELIKAGLVTNHLNLFWWWWGVVVVSSGTFVWSIHSSQA